MFGRYSLTDAYSLTPGPLPALSETHTFTTRTINDFRPGFNRLNTGFFNHPNFGLPDVSIGTVAAGAISSTVGSPRQNQLALKMIF